MEAVAIVGAGIAGLSCAQSLRAAEIKVRVFEREERVGGRCTTRLWQGHLIDDGVPYFTAQTAEFKRELLTRLRQFRPIIPPVVDAGGKIIVSVGGPRFFVLQGNNYFAQVLAQSLDVRVGTPVRQVRFRPEGGVEIFGEVYAAVVSSLPATESVQLFGQAKDGERPPQGIAALLEYAGPYAGESAGCYGHVLPEESETIAASYCESHKTAHIIDNRAVFVVHTSPAFSRAHAGESPEKYVDQIISANEALWNIPTGTCLASLVYSRRPRPQPASEPELPEGAFICGEASSCFHVEEEWHDGRRAADEVLSFLAGKTQA